ncbi:MAG: PD-(D/E)XK nuclease family protein [Nitrospirae bacterium]|nr:MAG: PD-(D/E)XK nuclease family protein [Nitrospirota bacterium]
MGEFNIKGRIDRVEQRDEQLYIIDYKTTYTRTHLKIDLERLNPDERSSWSESVRSIQIPLYVILYTRVHSPQHPPRGLYLLLGRAGIDRDSIEFEPLVFTPETLNAVEGFVLRVLKEINSPEVPFLPPQDMKRSCPRCNYQEVCGTKWVKGSAY